MFPRPITPGFSTSRNQSRPRQPKIPAILTDASETPGRIPRLFRRNDFPPRDNPLCHFSRPFPTMRFPRGQRFKRVIVEKLPNWREFPATCLQHLLGRCPPHRRRHRTQFPATRLREGAKNRGTYLHPTIPAELPPGSRGTSPPFGRNGRRRFHRTDKAGVSSRQ